MAPACAFSHPRYRQCPSEKRAGERGRQLHFFGLLSDGGVHSHQNHLYALLKAAKQQGVDRVFVHAFMDGRDTMPTSRQDSAAALEQKMREYGIGKIASVSGRYYAMDRDRRWGACLSDYAMVQARPRAEPTPIPSRA